MELKFGRDCSGAPDLASLLKHFSFVRFNPVWNEEFKFGLRSPETAMLRLCVKDYDPTSANDFIGEFSVPVTSIRPGQLNLLLIYFCRKHFITEVREVRVP